MATQREWKRASGERERLQVLPGEVQAAFLLGFDEIDSFTRAFRAWEGTTRDIGVIRFICGAIGFAGGRFAHDAWRIGRTSWTCT
ncbi:hypothetical protein [Polyangium sp. 6x1]|uniref:hypothetical protein n=1 Tax=Polyangium sp. 6x1 TaxID=3042689 RepID=UPI002482E5D6|nr:hypothetical protein [Polyangium sp. 6x1]MDI1447902.1 hypothetical protein [Polyangium sp. 6x1]